jgi:hypothetical protein
MGYQRAQDDFVKMVAPTESQVLTDFITDPDNNATSRQFLEDDRLLIDMSVWETKEALFDATYHAEYVDIFGRRKVGFHEMSDLNKVRWSVPEGLRPAVAVAGKHLEYLDPKGGTPYFYGIKRNYTYSEAENYAILK